MRTRQPKRIAGNKIVWPKKQSVKKMKESNIPIRKVAQISGTGHRVKSLGIKLSRWDKFKRRIKKYWKKKKYRLIALFHLRDI